MPDTVTREIKDAIQKGFTDAQTAVTRHTSEIIGQELGGAIEDAKKLTGVALKPLSGAFKSLTGKTIDKGTKKTHSYLQQMVDYFHRQEKAQQRMFDPKAKKSPWYRMVAGLGLLIGAIAGKLLLPFTLLFKALMKIPPFAKVVNRLKSFFRQVMGFSKLVESPIFKKLKIGRLQKFFIGFVLRIQKMFAPFLKMFKFIAPKIPLFGTFFSAIKTGFKFLGWPLTILIGLIDFIKGFASTEGSLFDKIVSGLWSAFEGFIALPVKLIGWVVDWIAKQFGIEIEGGAGNAIMEGIKKIFFMIADGWKMIGELVGSALSWAMDTLGKKLKEWGVVKFLEDAWTTAKELFGKAIDLVAQGFWWLVDLFKDFVLWLPDWIVPDEMQEFVEGLGQRPEQTPSQTLDEIDKEKQRSAEEARRRAEQKEKEEQRQREKDREEQKRTNDVNIKTATALTNTTNNNQRSGPEYIPDQSENNLIGISLIGS